MKMQLHKNKKLDIIAHTLTRCGITIWQGIPEQIVQDLHTAGYKIKKRKNFRSIKKDVDSRRIPAAVIKSQHETDDIIYL